MLTDTELLRRYAEDRSEAAFGELVARHVNLVYSTALRLVGGDEQLARDVAQSVFTDLARKAVSICNRRREVADGETLTNPSLSGWVYTGARFAAAKLVRDEQTRRKHEREAQAMNELLSSDSHEPEWSELRGVLDDALGMLSDAEREAVLLRYFEGNDFHIVGAALGLSEDAARKRVSRALDKLRDVLARRGVTTTSTALSATLASHAVHVAPIGLAAAFANASLAAAVTTPTSILGLIQFMASTKIKLALAALVAAGVATPLVLQHQTMNQLRATNNGLRAQLATVPAAPENQPISDIDPNELSRLRGEHAELMRLRGEVALLRKQIREQPGDSDRQLSRNDPNGTAEPQPNEAIPSSGKMDVFLPIPTESELSLATPEAALQTVLWAVLNGDGALYQKATVVEENPERSKDDFGKREVERKLELLKGLKGVRVTQRIGKDLHFTYEWEKAPPLKNSPTTGIISLALVGNEWKVGTWSDMI
ncbi:MAG TPA: sigma-70 family RNA polymerase sigma factor, partial [Gemmatimonadaceae bacterium]|nr:sigma-70 family RNA polymerase sigma factor [Gemmatimonadaceae bacterium]